MNNFYPGPSKLYPQVKEWLAEIYDSDILSKNHRSDAFMQLWEDTETKLKASLNIPADYEIYITSSATECWEIVNQSLIFGNTSYVYNGAFGEKWTDYAIKNNLVHHRNGVEISEVVFNINAELQIKSLQNADTICLTHNETSNGTFLNNSCLNEIRNQHPNALIALDATSSMAGVLLPWQSGDVWFASVQKCFGLPSGMALMVVSPKAIERAEEVSEQSHYNSFLNIRANFLKNQTPYTPNILGIALLNKQAEFIENSKIIDERIRSRAKQFYQFIEQETPFDLLVENEAVCSPTVISVKTENPQKVISRLAKHNIIVGKGYGDWKETTFRIANFPAIDDEEFDELRKVLIHK